MPHPFDELLACSWRGITFATTGFTHDVSQDQAQHKYPDRDGARIEATGRNPQTFSAHCLFRFSLASGQSEAGALGTPFPDQLMKFMTAMADRTTGTLVHPIYGPILCKPQSATLTLTATMRDGADVDARWVEDTDSEETSDAILASRSVVTEASLAAIALDSQIVQNPIIRDPGDPLDPGASFEDGMRSIKGVFDKGALLTKKLGGRINSVIYRVESVQDSIDSSRDPQLWPAKQSCVRLKDALVRLAGQLLVGGSDVKRYIVPGDTTLASLATRLFATTTEMILLNPDLVSDAVIPRGTVVRYYFKPALMNA